MQTNQYGQKYVGNDDFRGYLAANGFDKYLAFTGNDGGIDSDALNRSIYGTGRILGDTATGIREIQSSNNNDPNSIFVRNAPSIASGLYSKWSAARKGNSGDQTTGSDGWLLGASTASNPDEQNARLQIDQGINQANDALGRLDRQQESALGNIGNDYNSAYNRLLGQKTQANQGYETSRNNQLQDYQTAREDVANNSRNLLVGARRLLGSQGAGGGSAERYAAPNAAQIEGSKNNAVVQKTNSRNLGAITAAQEDSERQFGNSFQDLGRQKETSERGARSQFEQQRADILNTIATLTGQRAILNGQNYAGALAAAQPYTSRISTILDAIDRLAVNPGVIREQSVNVARPNLEQYAYDRFTAPRANAPAPQDQSLLSPAVAALLGTDERQRQQL